MLESRLARQRIHLLASVINKSKACQEYRTQVKTLNFRSIIHFGNRIAIKTDPKYRLLVERLLQTAIRLCEETQR